MTYKKILIALIILFSSLLGGGDGLLESTLTRALVDRNFENVAVTTNDKEVIITYENRIYRSEIEAIGIIFAVVNDLSVKSFANLVLIPQNRKIPIAVISVMCGDLHAWLEKEIKGEEFSDKINVSFDTDEYSRLLKGIKRVNNSSYQFDYVIAPKFAAELDEYGDPVKLQIGLAPRLETSFGKGSLIKSEYIIPFVHRDFKVGDPVDPFRPGMININQTIRFPDNLFFSTTLGIFTQNRFGIDLEMRKYLFNGIMSLGSNFGFTGGARFYNKKYETSILEDFTWFLDAEARIPQYNMSIAASYGQYIYKDKGFRIDISRQFGEVDIGFFFTSTSNELLGKLKGGGFNFSVPIFPSEYAEPGLARVRTDDYFSWEYDYNNFVYFHQKRYNTGNNIKSFIKRLQPDYIKREFSKYNFDK